MYGVSVIVPAFKALGRISVLLDSLRKQTLTPSHFEIVVILNGEEDGTAVFLQEWKLDHPEVQLKWFRSSPQGAAHARNLGLGLSSYDYVTFIDDDDAVGPDFLRVGLDSSSPQVVGLVPIVDRHPGDEKLHTSTLTERIQGLRGKTIEIVDHPWIMSFNASKFIHRSLLSGAHYDPSLSSGEDVVFFAHLLRHPRLRASVPADTSKAEYIRVLRQNSTSRRALSFEFNVHERVKVIRALEDLEVPSKALGAKQALQDGQASFIQKFILENPHAIDQVREEVRKERLVNFPWSVINRKTAEELVISYCFAPYSDTSAVVIAKRIRERSSVVDVIANDMSSVRGLDTSLLSIGSEFIDSCLYVGSPTSFSDWESNCNFAEEALKLATQNKIEKKGYKRLYSRALWMGSHLAAAIYKIENPAVTWTAEFSDPLRVNSEGLNRPGKIVWNRYAKRLKNVCESAGIKIDKNVSAFHLVEAATIVLADKLLFTNENQEKYILQQYSSTIQEIAYSKSAVEPQPTPPPYAYHLADCNLSLDSGKVNIGYFGNFYRNRGLAEVFSALGQLKESNKKLICLHVFSSDPDVVREASRQYSCSEVVVVHDYLPYLEFLNSLTRMDVLLVNDANTEKFFPENPFLPSKYSDYAGSGTAIWGVVEIGSPLSQTKLDYESELGDIAAAGKTLSKLLQSKTFVTDAPKF